MRKRDRDKLAKLFYELAIDIDHFVTQQLLSATWYFENNSEYKGYDFANASADCAIELGNRIKNYININIKKEIKLIKATNVRKRTSRKAKIK